MKIFQAKKVHRKTLNKKNTSLNSLSTFFAKGFISLFKENTKNDKDTLKMFILHL